MRRLRHLGTAPAGGVDCSSIWQWPPNILNPTCYAITAAKLFGNPAQQTAAYALTSPDVAYPGMPMPAAPAGPSPDVLNAPPANEADANAAVSDVIARTKAASDQIYSDYFSGVANNLDSLKATAGDTNWALIGAAAAAGLLLLLLVKGGRRI